MKVILATEEEYDGAQRKLGWFMLLPNGLYFDMGLLRFGSHTSYHIDGNVFRTSPATGGRATLQGRHVRLDEFNGWHQLGVSALSLRHVVKNSPVKAKDRKKNRITSVSLKQFPADPVNVVVELVSDSYARFLDEPSLRPPTSAIGVSIRLGRVQVLLTLLGHEENQLIKFNDRGYTVHHFNSRFSANRDGVRYDSEAYRDP